MSGRSVERLRLGTGQVSTWPFLLWMPEHLFIDAKDDALSCSTPAALAWPVAAEHGLVELQVSIQLPELTHGRKVDRLTKAHVGALHRLEAHARVVARPVRWHAESEEVEQMGRGA